MTLHDLIASDAATVFCNVSDFAEAVTYIQKDGWERCINAVVERVQYQALAEDGGQVVLATWQVHVANDSELGISSTELNLGGDKISFPPRDGQEAVSKTVLQLLTQDHGMLVLECR
jgi:hypothetical protein